MTHRHCNVCGKIKPVDDFIRPHEKGKKLTYRRKTCYICTVSRIRKWADDNRQHVNANSRKYNRTMKGKVNNLYNAAAARAKTKNQPILITKEQIHTALIIGICQKTYLPFDLKSGNGDSQHPLSPSIDKIDPNGIYEPNNVQYVCWWYNISKQKWDDETVLKMCRRMVEIYGYEHIT